jgi:hypothetical protein
MQGRRNTVIAVLTLTLLTGVAHGVLTARWSGGRDSALVIPDLSAVMGDWVASDDETDKDDPGMIHFTRRYTHSKTGRSFLILLTVGHPGLTAVHTPEYCYRGSGYDQAGPVERRSANVKNGPSAAFFTTQFEKKSAAGTEQLRVFWAWSDGRGWEAPGWPRCHYLSRSSVFKLYVVAGGLPDVTPGRDPALDDFLATLLGTLNQTLFAPPGVSSGPATP